MNKCLFLPHSLKVSLLPCSISFLLGVNPFQQCSSWWCRLFLVSEEQLQLPCQIPQCSKGPVHRLRGHLIPLETPISTPVKVGALHPLNSNEHSRWQDQNNTENSILVNGGIHLYTSAYQPWTRPQNPYRHTFQRWPPSIFNSLVNESLLVEKIQFCFQGRPWGPQYPTHIWGRGCHQWWLYSISPMARRWESAAGWAGGI